MAPEGRPSGPVAGRTLTSLADGFLYGEMSAPFRTPLRGYNATGEGLTAEYQKKVGLECRVNLSLSKQVHTFR